MKRISLFRGRDEAVNLVFPLICIVAVIWEMLVDPTYSQNQTNWLFFGCRIIFLNFVHTLFSGTNLIFVPEVKSWIGETKERLPWALWAWAGAAAFVVALSCIGKASPNGSEWTRLFFQFFVLINIHHVFAQMLGLSLLYNRKMKDEVDLVPAEVQKIKSLEKVERWLSLGVLVPILISALQPEKFGRTTETIICACVSFVFSLGIVALTFFYPNSARSNKTRFSLRYLILPFVRISLAARIGYLSIHGLEYLFVTRKMWSTSKIGFDKNLKKKAMWTSGFLILSFIALTLPDPGVLGFLLKNHYPQLEWLVFFMTMVTTASSVLHICIDHVLFRMRNPEVRQNILPLLAGEEIRRV